jgi:1-phosphofructokinase
VLGSDELEGDALIEGARTLQRRGAKNVLVSLGGEGSFLIDETGALHRARALAGTLMNSVGAGDSMVAGFVAGYTQAVSAGKRGVQAYDQAFAMAQACGSATAFSAGLATAETVAGLYARVLAGETRIA